MREYSRTFRVRYYELDSFAHVNNAVYVNYLQEAAIEASADAGFTPDWYQERGVGWVIRKLSIRYYAPASYRDELTVRTWISGIKRVSSAREYTIVRAGDGAQVVHATVNWAFVNTGNGHPTRIPNEFNSAFEDTGTPHKLEIRWSNPTQTDKPYRYHHRRRVQTNELDTARHVNHASYLRWIEQAYFDAMRAAGHPIESTRDGDWSILQGAHEIEYFEPAFDSEEIEIVSWVHELGKVRGAWIHEIYSVARQVLLSRDYSVGVFVNRSGRPVSAPADVINDVVRGPVR